MPFYPWTRSRSLILHRHKYTGNKEQTSLFKVESGQPLVKCRSVEVENINRRNSLYTDHDWMDWQADYMASALLMPKSTFRSAAQNILRQASITEGYITKGISNDWDRSIEAISFELAKIFQVSVQAAKIRCNKLGIIKEKAEIQKILF